MVSWRTADEPWNSCIRYRKQHLQAQSKKNRLGHERICGKSILARTLLSLTRQNAHSRQKKSPRVTVTGMFSLQSTARRPLRMGKLRDLRRPGPLQSAGPAKALETPAGWINGMIRCDPTKATPSLTQQVNTCEIIALHDGASSSHHIAGLRHHCEGE